MAERLPAGPRADGGPDDEVVKDIRLTGDMIPVGIADVDLI